MKNRNNELFQLLALMVKLGILFTIDNPTLLILSVLLIVFETKIIFNILSFGWYWMFTMLTNFTCAIVWCERSSHISQREINTINMGSLFISNTFRNSFTSMISLS